MIAEECVRELFPHVWGVVDSVKTSLIHIELDPLSGLTPVRECHCNNTQACKITKLIHWCFKVNTNNRCITYMPFY